MTVWVDSGSAFIDGAIAAVILHGLDSLGRDGLNSDVS